MTDIGDMSFNEVAELFREQQFQNETYRNEINRLTRIVEGYDRDEEILTLRRTITDQDIQIESLMNIGEGLYNGLLLAQQQLADENIGLRALARDAIQQYKDARGRK